MADNEKIPFSKRAKEFEAIFDDKDIDPAVIRAAFPEIQEGPVTLDQLEDLRKMIIDDGAVKTFEELSLFNQTHFMQERLRQEVLGSTDEQKLKASYRASYEVMLPETIQDQLDRLIQYNQKKAQFQKQYPNIRFGERLWFAGQQDFEARSAKFITELTRIMKARVAIGQMKALALIETEYGGEMEASKVQAALESLQESLASAPADKDGVSSPLQLTDGRMRSISRMSAKEILEDEFLSSATVTLYEELEMVLSFSKDVPGVHEDYIGSSPINVMYGELLAESLMANIQACKDNHGNKPARDKLVSLRAPIIQDIRNFRESIGRDRIERMGEATVHQLLNRTFAGDADRPADDVPLDLERMREVTKDEVLQGVHDIRAHFDRVLGEPGEDGIFTVTAEMDREDFWNKTGRYKLALTMLDASYSFRLGANKLMRWGASKLPLVPDSIVGGPIEDERREMIYPLMEEWGLPKFVHINGKDEHFDPWNKEHWDALTDEEWAAVKKAMQSTKDVLRDGRPKVEKVASIINDDLSVITQLLEERHPDDLIGTMPDEQLMQDIMSGNVVITPGPDGTLQQYLHDDAKLVAVYLAFEHQLAGHWEEYSEVMFGIDIGLMEVANKHTDSGTTAMNLAEAWPYLLAGLGAWYASAVWRGPKGKVPFRVWNTVRPTYLFWHGPIRMGKDMVWGGKKTVWAAGKARAGYRWFRGRGGRAAGGAGAASEVFDLAESGPGTVRGAQALKNVSARAARSPRLFEALADYYELMNRKAQIGSEIEALQASITPGNSQTQLAKISALEEELSRLGRTEGATRLRAARRMVGKRLGFAPAKSRAILAVHEATEAASKITDTAERTAAMQKALNEGKTMLRNAGFTNAQITEFYECGICGNPTRRLAGVLESARGAQVGDDAARVFAGAGADDLLVASSRGAEAGARTLTQQEKALLSRWWGTSVLRNMLYHGTAALKGFIVYTDVLALQAAEEHREHARKHVNNHLDQLVKDGIFTKEGDVYKYGDKVSVTIEGLAPGDNVTAANWRLAVDSVALGAMVAMGVEAFLGPPGWILIGCEIVVHTGIGAWENDEFYTYIQNVEPFLIARLGGTPATLGTSEYDILQDKMTDFIVQAYWDPEYKNENDLRKRLMFSWFMRKMGSDKPRLLVEMTGLDSPEEMNEFYAQDFEKQTLYFFKLHLIMEGHFADTDIQLIDDLDMENGSRWWGLNKAFFEKDVDRSLLKAGDWHIMYTREREFLDAHFAWEKEKDPAKKAILGAIRYELGSKHVFRRRLLDDLPELLKNGGRTRIEKIADKMRSTINFATGDDHSWLSIMEKQGDVENPVFTDTPMKMVDIMTGKKVGESVKTSYNRDFYISLEGIHGIQGSEDHPDRLHYRDMRLTDSYESPVPKLDEAVPDLSSLRVDPLYEGLAAMHAELSSIKRALAGDEKRLRRMSSYLRARTDVDNAKARYDSVQDQIDAITKKQNEIYKAQETSPYGREFGSATLAGYEKQIDAIAAQATPRMKEWRKERKRFERIKQDTFAYHPDELSAYDSAEVTASLRSKFSVELGGYLQALQMVEEGAQQFMTARQRQEQITNRMVEKKGMFGIGDAYRASDFSESVYGERDYSPLVVTANQNLLDDPKAKEWVLQLMQYPILKENKWAGVDNLVAVHINADSHIHEHNRSITVGDRLNSYLVTFVYCEHPDLASEGDEFHYVQVGADLMQTSYGETLDVGLPVIDAQYGDSDNARAEQRFQRTLFAEYNERNREERVESIKDSSLGERIIRAALKSNGEKAVQVQENMWTVIDRKNGFIALFQLNPDTRVWESVKVDIPTKGGRQISIQESAKRMVKSIEAGYSTDRGLTQMEQRTGQYFADKLANSHWKKIDPDLAKRFGIGDGTYSVPEDLVIALPQEILDADKARAEQAQWREEELKKPHYNPLPPDLAQNVFTQKLQDHQQQAIDNRLTALVQRLSDAGQLQGREGEFSDEMRGILGAHIQTMDTIDDASLERLFSQVTREIDSKQTFGFSAYEAESTLPR